MPGVTPPQDFAFFADESGISNDRFTVVGGLCVHRSSIPTIHNTMEAYREEFNMKSELKWTKVSNQKIEQYKWLVEHFFAMNNTNHIQFHSIIFDSHKANHKKYNSGDPDTGLSKLYYQLIVHKFAKMCGSEGDLFVCLDHRHSSTPLEDLRKMVNHTMARDHGLSGAPVKQLISRDSKTDDLLQLNDVILGAVCAVRNGRHLLSSTRAAKKEIAELVLKKSGLETFDQNTPKGVSRFTVWNFRAR